MKLYSIVCNRCESINLNKIAAENKPISPFSSHCKRYNHRQHFAGGDSVFSIAMASIAKVNGIGKSVYSIFSVYDIWDKRD